MSLNPPRFSFLTMTASSRKFKVTLPMFARRSCFLSSAFLALLSCFAYKERGGGDRKREKKTRSAKENPIESLFFNYPSYAFDLSSINVFFFNRQTFCFDLAASSLSLSTRVTLFSSSIHAGFANSIADAHEVHGYAELGHVMTLGVRNGLSNSLRGHVLEDLSAH